MAGNLYDGKAFPPFSRVAGAEPPADSRSGEGRTPESTMPDWVARQVTSARERTRDYEDSDEPTIMRRYDKSLVWLADALTRQQSALDAIAQAVKGCGKRRVQMTPYTCGQQPDDRFPVVLCNNCEKAKADAITSLLDTRETTA